MMMRNVLFFTLLTLILLPAASFSRPVPPPELIGMFDQLEKIEATLKSRDWAQARLLAGKTSESFVRLTPVMKSERPKETETAAKSLKLLKAATDAQSFERAHLAYVDFQQQLIFIMDAFDFKIHPVIFLIDDFLKEAGAGFKKGDMEEVVNELHEIESLFDGKAKTLLEQRGAAQAVTERFADKVHSVRQAAAEKRWNETEKGLAELSNLFTMLSINFGSR